jgi:two-component system response regulator (stage 0 sporulation protein F)
MKGPAILLILDQPQTLENYGHCLRNMGYDILVCGSPGEGLNALEGDPAFMVIVSQDTPEFEGRLVLERSLQIHPEVPVLVIARIANMRSYLDAMELGAFDYLESPEPLNLAGVIEMQVLRCALAGKIEWERLAPVFSSRCGDHFQKPPEDGGLAPSARWEIPKGVGTELILRPQGNAKILGIGI